MIESGDISKIDIKNLPLGKLESFMTGLGEKPLRKRLEGLHYIGRLNLEDIKVSKDGTQKYLKVYFLPHWKKRPYKESHYLRDSKSDFDCQGKD